MMFIICGICWFIGIILTGYLLVNGDKLNKETSGFLNGFAIAIMVVAVVLSGIVGFGE